MIWARKLSFAYSFWGASKKTKSVKALHVDKKLNLYSKTEIMATIVSVKIYRSLKCCVLPSGGLVGLRQNIFVQAKTTQLSQRPTLAISQQLLPPLPRPWTNPRPRTINTTPNTPYRSHGARRPIPTSPSVSSTNPKTHNPN
jgi:hypothetical protein